jgi:hypothetical protein
MQSIVIAGKDRPMSRHKKLPKIRREKLPKLCYHKATEQAYVRLSGKDIYLGKFGSQKSKDLYDQKIAEWLANGRKLPQLERQQATEMVRNETVGSIVASYLERSAIYYCRATLKLVLLYF